MANSIVARLLIYEGEETALEQQLGSSLGDGVKLIRDGRAGAGPLTIRVVTLTPGIVAAIMSLGRTLIYAPQTTLPNWQKPAQCRETVNTGTGAARCVLPEGHAGVHTLTKEPQ